MRRVLDETGILVAPRDVTAAAGSVGVESFAESLLDPPDDLSGIGDAEAAALLTGVIDVKYSPSDANRALEALKRALDQPALADLIYWPRTDLSPGDIVRIARTTKGAALVPWLDSQCGTPAERCPGGSSKASLSAARRALMALELTGGEIAASELASAIDSGAGRNAIVARLLDDIKGVAEVFWDDAALVELLAREGVGQPLRCRIVTHPRTRRTLMEKCIGLDVHATRCTAAVVNAQGKRLGSHVIETNVGALIEFLAGRSAPRDQSILPLPAGLSYSWVEITTGLVWKCPFRHLRTRGANCRCGLRVATSLVAVHGGRLKQGRPV